MLLTHLKYFKIPAIGKNFISSGKTGLRYPEMFLLLQSLRASGAGAGAAGNAGGGAACPQAGGSCQEQSEGVQHSTAHLLHRVQASLPTQRELLIKAGRAETSQTTRPDRNERIQLSADRPTRGQLILAVHGDTEVPAPSSKRVSATLHV